MNRLVGVSFTFLLLVSNALAGQNANVSWFAQLSGKWEGPGSLVTAHAEDMKTEEAKCRIMLHFEADEIGTDSLRVGLGAQCKRDGEDISSPGWTSTLWEFFPSYRESIHQNSPGGIEYGSGHVDHPLGGRWNVNGYGSQIEYHNGNDWIVSVRYFKGFGATKEDKILVTSTWHQRPGYGFRSETVSGALVRVK